MAPRSSDPWALQLAQRFSAAARETHAADLLLAFENQLWQPNPPATAAATSAPPATIATADDATALSDALDWSLRVLADTEAEQTATASTDNEPLSHQSEPSDSETEVDEPLPVCHKRAPERTPVNEQPPKRMTILADSQHRRALQDKLWQAKPAASLWFSTRNAHVAVRIATAAAAEATGLKPQPLSLDHGAGCFAVLPYTAGLRAQHCMP